MTFDSELTALREATDTDYIAHIREASLLLKTAGAADGVRRPGQGAPDFLLSGPSGEMIALSRLLRDGPVVISFFRGEWCPFCEFETRALLAVQPAMAALGAKTLLISSERPSDGLVSEVAAAGEGIWILRDPMLGVALSYGLVYLVPAPLRRYYLDTDFNIAKLYSTGSWLLPLPADFVIGTDGRIALSYAEVDFTLRLDPASILSALAKLPA